MSKSSKRKKGSNVERVIPIVPVLRLLSREPGVQPVVGLCRGVCVGPEPTVVLVRCAEGRVLDGCRLVEGVVLRGCLAQEAIREIPLRLISSKLIYLG